MLKRRVKRKTIAPSGIGAQARLAHGSFGNSRIPYRRKYANPRLFFRTGRHIAHVLLAVLKVFQYLMHFQVAVTGSSRRTHSGGGTWAGVDALKFFVIA